MKNTSYVLEYTSQFRENTADRKNVCPMITTNYSIAMPEFPWLPVLTSLWEHVRQFEAAKPAILLK